MLERWAQRMAVSFVKSRVIQGEDEEVYAYCIRMLMASLISWMLMVTIALASGQVIATLIYCLGFYLLRSVAGGYHASNHLRCITLTVGTYLGFIWLIDLLPGQWDKPLSGLLTLVTLVCIWCYAPMDTQGKPFSPTERVLYKQKSRIPEDKTMVLMTFNEYMDAIEVERILEVYDSVAEVNEIFISQPNETGRAIIASQGDTIQQSIESELKTIMTNNLCDNTKTDIQSLLENYKVFSISFNASNADINLMLKEEFVKSMDLFSDPEAENQARISGQDVSYIALPQKPDGTY